jgi:hypothetical protein
VWKVDVWHPEFQPVEKTYDVEIKRDEVTELAVEFLPPASLAEPAAKPAAP